MTVTSQPDGAPVKRAIPKNPVGDRRRTDPKAFVAELRQVAIGGLYSMYEPSRNRFAFTARGVATPKGMRIKMEGSSLRYSAISALGLASLPTTAQKGVLAGRTAASLAADVANEARDCADPGAVALASWAASEVCGETDGRLLERLATYIDDSAPLPIVDLAWAITAVLAAGETGADVGTLVEPAVARLLREQGPAGLFPHMGPASAAPRWRRHVGCFADQVYPIQALSRAHRLFGISGALAGAEAAAEAICHLQGADGQWWWHYDARTRQVVEGYPVYSVHQHAMAPMALADLRDAGGTDLTRSVDLGIRWLLSHPEVEAELVDPALEVIWRKVGRREPRKAARGLATIATAFDSRAHLPALDVLLPVGRIDYECRPYELGWLLYTHRS